jgi:uncharacterized protein (TIGR03437 family)
MLGTPASVQVPVTLTVVAAPTAQTVITAIPSSLSLSVPTGQSRTQTIILDSTGAPILFKFIVDSLGADWLQPLFVRSDLTNTDGQVATPATISFGVNANNLLPGTYHHRFVLTWATGSLTIPLTLSVTPSASHPPVLAAVVNAASSAAGAIAPGEIIAIFGTGIGPAPTGLTLDAAGKVATNSGGTELLINGIPAPLIYVSATQVNAIVPYEVGTKGSASLQIVSGGVLSGIWNIAVASTAPAIFSIGSTGLGLAAVLNQDNSVNGPSNPASRGTLIQIYGTGEGLTSPPGITGSVTGSNPNKPVLSVVVAIDGVNAAVQYAGSAPNAVAGLFQVNAAVPQSVTSGPAIPISMAVGGVSSQNGMTIAVK